LDVSLSVKAERNQTNVLVDGDGVAKLGDFGLVRLADWEGPTGMTTTSPYTGTLRYKAPELFVSEENRHPVATFEGDIYSIGCILLEVCGSPDNTLASNQNCVVRRAALFIRTIQEKR
jgi:serine/threonine protein kinase